MAENPRRETEQEGVLRQRYKEAQEAGMTCVEALEFAASDRDIGQLRLIVKKGCPPPLVARIVL